MPVTYIERRRISRNKFIGFTPIGDRSVARRRIPRQSRFYLTGRGGRRPTPFWSGVGSAVLLPLRFAIRGFVDSAILSAQLERQLFLAWKIRQIFGGKHLVVVFGQRVFDNRIAFVRAEHDAYG